MKPTYSEELQRLLAIKPLRLAPGATVRKPLGTAGTIQAIDDALFLQMAKSGELLVLSREAVQRYAEALAVYESEHGRGSLVLESDHHNYVSF